MPVHSGHNSAGTYYQWGSHGKKYYYHSPLTESAAKKKALAQGKAIHSKGYQTH